MKKTRLVLVGALACFLFFSCVNEISDNNDKSSKTVIKITSSITDPQTRVKDNSFETNDSIGLFVLTQPNKLSEERCVNNACFTYSLNSVFISEKDLFYPDGNYKCDFISYYPYQKSGIKAGQTELIVSINKNQTSIKSFASSDFLVARQNGILASKEPVSLSYKHRFCKIKLKLKMNGIKIDSLLVTPPIVYLNKIKTKCTYNLQTDSLYSASSPQKITPYGEWIISGEYLIGKEVIIIPQTILSGTNSVSVKLGSNIFSGSIPDTKLISGKSEELIITCNQSNNTLTASFNHSIDSWEDNSNIQVPTNEITNLIDLSALSFEESSIYKIYVNGLQIGELCKEYLLSDNINAQAIVYYPVSDNVVNLAKGTALRIINRTEEIHGGSVQWNLSSNTLNYTAGNLADSDEFYIDVNNQLSTYGASNYPNIEIKADILTDIREDESITYPIIKIGTQYWQRGNMKATYYISGEPITLKTDFSTESAGYGKPTTSYCFYNQKAVTSGKIAPIGWSIPTSQDWQKLITYIQNDASVLKGGTSWIESEYPVNNLSGFYAVGAGYFDVTYTSRKEQIRYWMAGNTQTSIADKAVCLQYSSNKITEEFHKTTNGLSLRMIRK